MIVPEKAHLSESKLTSEVIEHIEPVGDDVLEQLTEPLEELVLKDVEELRKEGEATESDES